jgi:hypothetical protein
MPEHARGVNLTSAPKLLHLGRFRGGPLAQGGFYIEIVGNGEVRRAEMTPRETVVSAKAMLLSQGVDIPGLDPMNFKHRDG